ncbi:hypothetical protein DFP72DRAFT_851810 [Ephemerocybe angulata]|uniref:Uncharacterized protein n=1 Tax=Ephemerocybe angulata TaxID=980116 RepID=A0A8H6HPS6_9AGAR|nr:hypothetical protein DFP72DRAFT_851810 [Tulosesus angulatus]
MPALRTPQTITVRFTPYVGNNHQLKFSMASSPHRAGREGRTYGQISSSETGINVHGLLGTPVKVCTSIISFHAAVRDAKPYEHSQMRKPCLKGAQNSNPSGPDSLLITRKSVAKELRIQKSHIPAIGGSQHSAMLLAEIMEGLSIS